MRDLNGQIVHQMEMPNISNYTDRLDVSNLVDGLYMLEFKDIKKNIRLQSFKLVIAHN